MRPTLLRPSLLSRFTRKLKDPEVPSEILLLDFKRPGEIDKLVSGCDQDIGGYSTVDLSIDPKEQALHFSGVLNLDTPVSRPDVKYSGYSMFRTKSQKTAATFFGRDSYWDWNNLTHIAMRVKGDRRKYFVNIQADSPLPQDVYQHRLFLHNPGKWETVLIPLNGFVLTNYGVIQEQQGLDKTRIKTFGIGLLDKKYGPYSLYVDWVKVLVGDPLKQTIKEAHNSGQEGKDVVEESTST